ncbi:hypothetical protein PACTADRAFT_29370, partial [Pachysolen tannophilus NRRL Y-2460]
PPPLLEILPAKKHLQKLLFDFDSRLNYQKYLPILQSIYEKEPSILNILNAKKVKGSDLMIFRNILKEIRYKTHTKNKHLILLENSLIEYAAELGDNNAVAILAFDCIKKPDEWETGEVDRAKKLIRDLLLLKHPLTLKLSGDYEYEKNNDYNKAIDFYQDFLKIENNTYLASQVFQTLGILNFKLSNLNLAEHYLQKSIKFSTLDKISHAYYYLGVIHEDDPKLSRYYFEMSASQGFKESFKSLGFLELNYFQNINKAMEWFKLGVELGDISCLVGIFDCYMKLKDYDKALKIVTQLKSSPNTNNGDANANANANSELNTFFIARKESINNLN